MPEPDPSNPNLSMENVATQQKQAVEQKEAEQKKIEEQKKAREKEIEDIARLDREIIAYLHHQRAFEKATPEEIRGTKQIYSEEKLAEAISKQQSEGGLMAATGSSFAGLREDGVYQFKGVDIRLKDGQASFIDPPQDNEKLIDFLRESTGEDTLYVDFPTFTSGPNAGKPNVNEDELENIIAIAKKKGINVEFGPNLERYLQEGERYRMRTIKPDEGILGKILGGTPNIFTLKHLDAKDRKIRWDYFHKLKMECNSHAKKVIAARNDTSEYKEAKEKLTYLRCAKTLNKEKLADTPEKLDKLKAEIAKLSDAEKIEKIKDYRDNINSRSSKLHAAIKELDTNAEFLRHELTKYNKSNISEKGFIDLENRIVNNQNERKSLIAAIEKEQTDLKALKSFCEQQVTSELQSNPKIAEVVGLQDQIARFHYLPEPASLEDFKSQVQQFKTSLLDQRNAKPDFAANGILNYTEEQLDRMLNLDNTLGKEDIYKELIKFEKLQKASQEELSKDAFVETDLGPSRALKRDVEQTPSAEDINQKMAVLSPDEKNKVEYFKNMKDSLQSVTKSLDKLANDTMVLKTEVDKLPAKAEKRKEAPVPPAPRA